MSYVESNLVPGETVIYQTRLHWIVMLGHIVVGCLLLAARVASIPRQYAQASRSNGGGSDKSPFPLEPGSILRSSLDFFPRLMICTHLDIRHTYLWRPRCMR